MIVDAWIQHPTPAFLRHPSFEPLRRWMRMEEVPESISLDFTLQALEQAGVDLALASAWHGPSGALISNDDVAGWVAASGGRLRGVGSVDLRRPMAAVREVARCKRLGFVGIRVLPWLWDLPPDDRRYYPVYAACVEHALPFCLQVGHTGPLMPSEPGRPIPYLDRVALEFPELVIVGGHVGHPWEAEMVSLATKYPNVYIDTSAYKPSRYPAGLVDFMRGKGRKKVLFGTNYPMLGHGACIDEVSSLGLDAEAEAMFLSGNARRIFKL